LPSLRHFAAPQPAPEARSGANAHFREAALERDADRAAESALSSAPGPLALLPPRKVRFAKEPDAGSAHVPGLAEAVRDGGRPLDASTRAFFEMRFARDFGGVRVHDGADAARAARSVGALAFTTGSHVAFGAGRYRPETASGRRLLAHELAHVAQQETGGAPPLQRKPDPSADAVADPAGAIAPDEDVVEGILRGWYRGRGEFEADAEGGFVRFLDARLQAVLEFYVREWAPRVPLRQAAPSGGFDSLAKSVAVHPSWLKDFQERLMGQQPLADPGRKVRPVPGLPPQWSRDSEVAQRLIEAYLLAWDRRIGGGADVHPAVAELYERVGASETNRQAYLVGGDPGSNTWCAPASQAAMVLSLMKAGFRFRKKAIPGSLHSHGMKLARARRPTDTDASYRQLVALAFKEEVLAQSNHYLSRWVLDKSTGTSRPRTIGGAAAATAALDPGDYVTLVNGNHGSPLSGHVVTVIREEWMPGVEPGKSHPAGTELSRLYVISGNSRGVADREGAVRAEVVVREMPHPDYRYFQTAAVGNEYDARMRSVSATEMEEEKKYGERLTRLFYAMLPGGNRAVLGKPPGLYLVRHKYDLPAMEEAFGSHARWPEYAAVVKERNADTELLGRMDRARESAESYRLEKLDAGVPVSRRDPTFDSMNTEQAKGTTTGRYSPLQADHSWVATVVKGSLLDAGRLRREIDARTTERTRMNLGAELARRAGEVAVDDPRTDEQIAAEFLGVQGLEPMPDTIENLWPGALEYWEGLGAFG